MSTANVLFPLDAISTTFPEDVDVRLVANSLGARLYVGVCQFIYAFNEEPGKAIELSANHPGLTPLMLAATANDIAAARLLLQRGASVGLTNCYGRTALMLAAAMGNFAIIKLLLSVGAATDVVDVWGRDAATWAQRRGHMHLIPLLDSAAQKQKDRQRHLLSRHSAAAGIGLEEEDLAHEAAERAVREAKEALERAAAEEEAARAATATRKAAAAAAAQATRASPVPASKPRSTWGMGMFSSRKGQTKSPREANKSPREIFEREEKKPSPPPGAYAVDPKAARVLQARKQAALSSRGRMLSTASPRTRKQLLRNRPPMGYLSPKRQTGPSSNKVLPTGGRGRVPYAPKVSSHGGYENAHGKMYSHSRGVATYAEHYEATYHAQPKGAYSSSTYLRGGTAALGGRDGGLSRAEADLLARPIAGAGWPAAYKGEPYATGDYPTRPPPKTGGGSWGGWFGGSSPRPGEPRDTGGKQRPADERGGPIDDRERMAVERRRDPDWGEQARGAVTDPSRFMGYTAEELGYEDEDDDYYDVRSDASYVEQTLTRSSRYYWDSARGRGGFGGDNEFITTEDRQRNLESQRKRMWISSSRRWVEEMKAKGPLSKNDRKEAQKRLYQPSARAVVGAVYA